TTRGSSVSAQVYFSQTHEGLLIIPGGEVKVDLGPQGELLGLYSSYAMNVVIVNEIRLDSEQAKAKVISFFQDPKLESLYIDGGARMIWVQGHEGRYVYQFSVRGQEIIVDAQTGKILSSRNRRQN